MCVEFMIVVTPLALVLSVVTDIPVPNPSRVVPLGRFEHVADESVKSASNVFDQRTRLRRCCDNQRGDQDRRNYRESSH